MAEGDGERQATGAQSARPDVFISYASQDASVADGVVAALENQGLKCWIAPRDVTPGEFYSGAIVHAIDAAKVIVLILSGSSASSPNVLREVERAASKRHPVVSLRIDQVPLPADLQYFLNTSQWLDASAIDMARAMPKLVAAIHVAIGKATTPDAAVTATAATATGSRTSYPSNGGRSSHRIAIVAGLLVASAIAGFGAYRSWHPARRALARSAPTVAAATPAAAAVIPEKSVAVLPFVDMSEKKDQEYFADGMAEEILSLLARLPALKVVGRTSSFQFKGQSRDLRKIGDALGVNYVVEGSVRRSGDRVRLTAQLIDARTGTPLWSGTFERPVGDALKIQDEIAGNLTRALQISLGAGELELRPSLPNVDAYNLYLRGLHAIDQLDEAGFQEAIGYFKQSIDLDPTFAPAAGWLALAYDMQGEWGYVAPTTAFENARRAAEATVKIDPGFFLPYTVLASIHQVYDWDWAAGEAAVNRSIALAPREPLVHFFASRYALMVGRLDDALAQIQITLARDPLMPTAYVGVCWIQQRRGHLQEAEIAIRRALEISPSFVSGHYYLGLVLLARGEPKAALEAMRKRHRLADSSTAWR